MELVEYLYVDAKRLDTYFEQISSPVTYDKVPVWEASLTITSPGAKGSQQRFARPFTTHEKISKLTEHLEDKGLVGYGRATAQTRGTMFRIETCRAKRVFIPPDHGQPPEVGALNVWISAVPRTPEEIEAAFEGRKVPGERGRESPGNLYLLENYKHSDVNGFDYMSSYSALSLMIGDLPIPGSGNNHSGRKYFNNLVGPDPAGDYRREAFKRWWVDADAASRLQPRLETELVQQVEQNIDDAISQGKLDPKQRAAWLKRFDQHTKFMSYFFIDPAGALAQIGAEIGPERRIRTLYRVRVEFSEEELWQHYGMLDLATFGYPIFIAEDTEPA